MNILITGATGFLGHALACQLLERGHHLTLMGRNFSGVRELLYMGAEPLRLDLRDRAGVRQACRNQEVVCHVGALSSAWGAAQEFHEINVGGTRAVLEGCLAHGVRRLVYVSSPSVVFDGRNHRNLTEDAVYPGTFLSSYAETKKLGEDLVLGARALLEVAVLRPKALYGPGDRSLLPRLLERAASGHLRQVGDGQNRVDLTHVDDAAYALRLAAEHPGPLPSRALWNVTGGESVLLWEVIRRVLEHAGLPGRLRQVSERQAYLAASAMEQWARLSRKEPPLTRYTTLLLARTQTYSLERIRRDLGCAPQVPFELGFAQTLSRLER